MTGAAPPAAGAADRPPRDGGNAIIEFLFLGLLLLLPLAYLIAAVAVAQRSTLAVRDAARNAGRAFATSDTTDQAWLRARTAVRLALADQGLPDDAQLRFVPAGSGCGGRPTAPRLVPGAVFGVCVIRQVALPGIPSLLAGRGVRTIGEYVVHVDDYRVAGD